MGVSFDVVQGRDVDAVRKNLGPAGSSGAVELFGGKRESVYWLSLLRSGCSGTVGIPYTLSRYGHVRVVRAVCTARAWTVLATSIVGDRNSSARLETRGMTTCNFVPSRLR